MKKLYFVTLLMIIFTFIFSCNLPHKNQSVNPFPYRVEEREFKFGDTLFYQIDIRKPIFIPTQSKYLTLNALNLSIDAYLDSILVYYWSVDTTEAKRIVSESGTAGYYILENNYQIKDTTEKIISVVFETYTYALGAHGFNAINTFNYNIETDRIMTLDDVVDLSKSEKLQVMNMLLEKYFVNEADCFFDVPSVGINFKRFAIAPDYLIFYWEAYELGPYVCGSVEVKVPINELEKVGILKMRITKN